MSLQFVTIVLNKDGPALIIAGQEQCYASEAFTLDVGLCLLAEQARAKRRSDAEDQAASLIERVAKGAAK